jgi:hypothetical protein
LGIFDNFVQRVAKEVVKAAPTVTDLSSLTQQQTSGYGNTAALQREGNLATVPFAPGIPLVPGAINPVRADGRPDPRRYEYQVAQNINITETRLVPFKTLRSAADQIDIVRRCVEVLKSKLVGLDWDIVLSEDAVESVAAESNVSNLRAQQIAKEQFGDQISKAKAFWKTPDQANGLIFADWLNMALEDVLVLDAWAVWPQKTVGGDLFGLQILDAATIKPLIDDRGMRPLPPNAAFQQILYGFPRSEFSAPDETEDADGEFSADELSYMVRNKRTTSVYGYSPVERSLVLADLYLRRQQWLRAEYTDGVLPELLFKTDASFGNNPDLLRAYENVFNDDLAGQTEQRKKARLLPAGLEPVQFDGYGEKFKDTLDEFLVTSICGHFGVMPTEIGFTPKTGLGGAGHQSGEGQSSEVIGLIPLQKWVGRMLSHLSYVYLGMPRELEFRFMSSERHDAVAEAQAEDIRLKNGSLAINEARAFNGLPLLEAEEADTPIFLAGTGAYLLTENGVMDFATGTLVDATNEDGGTSADEGSAPEGKPASDEETSGQDAVEDVSPEDDEDTGKTVRIDADVEETRQFIRWLKKSPSRPFEFKHLPVTFADTLNKFVSIKDYDGARWYAERYLP